MKRMKVIAAVALAIALLSAGCSYKLVRKGKLNRPLAKEIKQKVSERRGLEFKEPVEAQVIPRSEVGDLLKKEFREQLPVEEIKKLQRAYVRMGLIKPGTDIEKIMLDFYESNIAGFYNPRTKDLYLIKEVVQKFSLIEFIFQRDLSGELMLAHELTHALDDQHYDLRALEKRHEHNEDALLAIQALEEGTATLVSFAVLYRQETDMGEAIKAMERYNETLRKLISMAAGDVSSVLVDSVAFAYINGSEFVGYLYKKFDGWKKVNSAYSKPPSSSEEVYFPQKFIDKSDPPSNVTLLVRAETFGENWKSLETNTLGQLGVTALLKRYLPVPRAGEAAEGWGGDRYSVVGTTDGKHTLWIWVTDWDSAEDAGEFYAAYRDLLSVKYKNPEETDCPSGISEGKCFINGADEIIRLNLSGRRVSIIEGADKNTLPAAIKYTRNSLVAEKAPGESKAGPSIHANSKFRPIR